MSTQDNLYVLSGIMESPDPRAVVLNLWVSDTLHVDIYITIHNSSKITVIR